MPPRAELAPNPGYRALSRSYGWLAILVLQAACADQPALTAPLFKPGGGAATPLTATPTQLAFTLPPGTPATLTAKVQYVGTITATSSDAIGCATVTPSSVPASKPAGSSQYVATFTVTPVAVGACTITIQDKKGQAVEVPVSVEGAVTGGRIVYTSLRDGNLEIYLMGASGSVRLTNNPARDFDPVISPDGQKIAFVSDRDGTSSIYTMDADGTDVVRLTSGPGDIEPSFSPDGSKIAFSSYRLDYAAGGSEFTTDLWVMNADGTSQTVLFDDLLGASSPRFSPDGTRIVFGYGWHIWIMNADGSTPVQLTTQENNMTPSFSPDGTKIVYSSDVNSAFMDVWVMNVDGASPQRLTFANSGAGTPTFSPDGTRIAFGSHRNGNDDIYLIDAGGGNEVRLTADPAPDLKPRFGP
jgi:Tol biopolymer transport system component